MKIHIKLTILFVIVSLIVISITSYSFFVHGSKTIGERTKAHLESVAVLKENVIENLIRDLTNNLVDLTTSHILKENLNSFIKSKDDCYKTAVRNRLDEYLINNHLFIEFFIIDLDSKIIVSTDEMQEGKIKANDPYFVEGKKGTFVKNFYYSLTFQQPMMTISTPIKDNEGNLVAVLIGRVNLEQISKIMVEKAGLGETGETYLVNKFNYIVSKSRFTEGLEFKKTIHTEAVKDCLKGNNGYVYYNDYRNIPVLGVYRWIPEREVCLLAKIDEEEALAPINKLKNIIILINIGIIILTVMLGFFFSIIITKPIIELSNSTKEIAKGNFNVRIKPRSKDEIGQLAVSFNEMASELKKSKAELEKHSKSLERNVKNRTKELQSKVYELEKFNRITIGRELRMVELKKRIKELEEKLKVK